MASNAALISIAQAAELLGVSRDTVRRLLAAGELSSIKIRAAIRIPRAEVDRLVEGVSRKDSFLGDGGDAVDEPEE